MSDPALPMFYKRPRPLESLRDLDLSLATRPNYGFAAGVNAVPLVGTEMEIACRFFPILFAERDVPRPVVLLGLRSGENLFVGRDGDWADGIYIPAYVQRYPFILMESRDRSQYTLCVDEASDSVVQGRDNRFFDDYGPTDLTNAALAFCRDYQDRHDLTTAFATALRAADLLVDHRADINLGTGSTLTLAGFRIIDQDRFNSLPPDQLLQWRDRGWLHLVYCHFISMTNWSVLVDRAASLTVAA
jgi:hypothetical protein